MPDILIRGMEMPKDGHVIVRVYANGDVCEPTPCPGVWEKVARAIPIPEGYGRLGDLDALFEKMYLLSDNEGAHKDSHADDALILRDSACYLIEDAPTIIPAEGDADNGN